MATGYAPIQNHRKHHKGDITCVPGAVLAQNFWGGGIASISPFTTESIFSVLRNRKKYELHKMGLHLKSIISRVANSVMGYTLLRPIKTRPEGPKAGVSFLGRGQRAPSLPIS